MWPFRSAKPDLIQILKDNPQLAEKVRDQLVPVVGEPAPEPSKEVPFLQMNVEALFGAIRSCDERLGNLSQAEADILTQLSKVRESYAETYLLRDGYIAAVKTVDPAEADNYLKQAENFDLSELEVDPKPDVNWLIEIVRQAHVGEADEDARKEVSENTLVRDLWHKTRQKIEDDLVSEKAAGVPYEIVADGFVYPLGVFWERRWDELVVEVPVGQKPRRGTKAK